MKPKGKGVCATFCYFAGRKYILNLSSTCARASHGVVTCRQLPQPAVVHHWLSSAQYGSFIPDFDPSYSMGLFSGFCPLQKYFKRSYLMGWGCLNVELMPRRSSVCLCLYWLWFRPAEFLCSCNDHGQLLQGSFLKNPGTPPQLCDISWLW